MKKQKDIYSKVFNEFVFSDSQIELLHKTLFDMLMDIKRVCEKHDITFLLSGGSMLGAVRHKGFIPWDDDLDIMMLRSEYVKFRKAVLSEMTDKYDLVEPLDGKYTNKKPKLFLKNSVFTGSGLCRTPSRIQARLYRRLHYRRRSRICFQEKIHRQDLRLRIPRVELYRRLQISVTHYPREGQDR